MVKVITSTGQTSLRQDVMCDHHSAHLVKWLKIIKIMTVVELSLKKKRKRKSTEGRENERTRCPEGMLGNA